MKFKFRRGVAAGLLSAVWLGSLLGPITVSASPESGQKASIPLQERLDQAEPGSTVKVEAGTYTGPLRLAKPIRLVAEGKVVLTNPEAGESPVLSVETDGAVVSGLTVEDHRENPDSVAVAVKGSGNSLTGLTIRTWGFGIRLKEAHRNKLTELTIEGLTEAATGKEEDEAERGNGIDLWGSHNNVISHNRISNMFDGIYIESSEENLVERNSVTGSRYGYHLMFAKDVTVRENEGIRNVTGAMIMSDKGSKVHRNNFAKQSENATAQGILLFDVAGAVIAENRVEGNRVGLFAQGISDTRIEKNLFLRNFTGLQMSQAERNDIMGNHFMANVVQAQATADASNRVESNFWDDHQGLDLKGEGYSDLSYTVNPFFLALTERVPAYQIFFQNPGMALLEGLFRSRGEEAMTDAAPLMSPVLMENEEQSEGGAGTLAVGAGLLAVSVFIMILGGRKR